MFYIIELFILSYDNNLILLTDYIILVTDLHIYININISTVVLYNVYLFFTYE